MEYKYFIGCLILAILWTAAFISRHDTKKPMVWSGTACIIVDVILFILFKMLFVLNLTHAMIVPDYWNPKTFFNLGQMTGGLAVEDILFMFLVGGLAAALQKIIFKKKFKTNKIRPYHLRAIIVAIVAALAFAIVSDSNPIYSVIVGGFIGTAIVWIERTDLIEPSLVGGTAFLGMYFFAFLLFNAIFPNFISQFYNIKNISGIYALSVPLEELLYAFSFGMMWSPIYEYVHGEENL